MLIESLLLHQYSRLRIHFSGFHYSRLKISIARFPVLVKCSLLKNLPSLLRCLLVEDEGKLILIDNGMGDKQDAKFFGHYYLHGDDTLDKSLAQHGFTKDDITDVFLTHLHFDHCGGSIVREGEKLIPAFKNATYWSNERHWQWATEPNAREKASFLKENILPIQESGKLAFSLAFGSVAHFQ